MNIKGGMDVENDMKQPTAQEELAYINQFTKSPLTAEEVYFFPVRLCDNEVDRDFERFDRAALEKLGELFLGKSGLFRAGPDRPDLSDGSGGGARPPDGGGG